MPKIFYEQSAKNEKQINGAIYIFEKRDFLQTGKLEM